MVDKFKNDEVLLNSPLVDAFDITPSDVTVFEQATRAIYVGGAGNITVQMQSYDDANTEVTLSGVTVGTVLNIRVKKVLSTGTTATNLVGLY